MEGEDTVSWTKYKKEKDLAYHSSSLKLESVILMMVTYHSLIDRNMVVLVSMSYIPTVFRCLDEEAL